LLKFTCLNFIFFQATDTTCMHIKIVDLIYCNLVHKICIFGYKNKTSTKLSIRKNPFRAATKMGTYLVQTNPSVQPCKILIWTTWCWSRGRGGVGGGIWKRVISSGWLSVKLFTPLCHLDQHHVTQIESLHGCTEGLVCTRYVSTKIINNI
jgi:hypothetical protein